MKKQRLDLDQVQVESFATQQAKPERGTVNGFAATPVLACGESHGLSCNSCFPHYCPPMPGTE